MKKVFLVGQRAVIQRGESGPYILNCRIAPKIDKYVGSYATITKVTPNKWKDADAYPNFAEVEIEK